MGAGVGASASASASAGTQGKRTGKEAVTDEGTRFPFVRAPSLVYVGGWVVSPGGRCEVLSVKAVVRSDVAVSILNHRKDGTQNNDATAHLGKYNSKQENARRPLDKSSGIYRLHLAYTN